MNLQRYPLLLLTAAVVIGVIAATLFSIARAPVSDVRGNAPSALTGAPCEGVAAGERQSCLRAHEAQQARGATTGVGEPREVGASSAAAQAARGSGVEGITSGGTTNAADPAR